MLKVVVDHKVAMYIYYDRSVVSVSEITHVW